MADGCLQDDDLPLIVRRRIDRECLAFEDAWKSGKSPAIEDFLAAVRGAEQDAFLRELLLIDAAYRRQLGQQPTAEEYEARFPGHGELIGAALSHESASAEQNTRGARPGGDASSDPLASTDVPFGTMPAPGDRLGHFEVRKLLGQGGMGNVYLARDTELDIDVAIKVPRKDRPASKAIMEALLQEARNVVKLNHPSIVRVHYLGRDGADWPFMVMDFVDGKSLDGLLDSGTRLDYRRSAKLVAAVARAVHHAHQKGFVHRDLKPSNILLDREGRVHVTDFGLALHESAQQGRSGDRSGTPAYMAPEQFRGDAHHLDGRADVWALGAILYQLLTGQRPFHGDGWEEIKEEVLSREPKPPRQIDDGIPEPLERICLKCLAKDVTDRYPTAHDVARDLDRWLHPKGRRLLARLAAAAAVAVVAALLWFVFFPPRAQPVPPSSGEVNVLIWNKYDRSWRQLPSDGAAALPIRAGDQIRVKAAVNRRAYLYLLWIGTRGNVLPVYPWTNGSWQGPMAEEPVSQVDLPADGRKGWPMEDPSGMETLMLLARSTPLPKEVDLARLLERLPAQGAQRRAVMFRFKDGGIVGVSEPNERAPRISDPRSIDDPVYQTQRMIQDRMGKYFQLSQAISFANQGEEEEP